MRFTRLPGMCCTIGGYSRRTTNTSTCARKSLTLLRYVDRSAHCCAQSSLHSVFASQFYKFAIVNNLICRLLFSLSLSVGWTNLFFPDGLVLFLAVAEVYRYGLLGNGCINPRLMQYITSQTCDLESDSNGERAFEQCW